MKHETTQVKQLKPGDTLVVYPNQTDTVNVQPCKEVITVYVKGRNYPPPKKEGHEANIFYVAIIIGILFIWAVDSFIETLKGGRNG